MLISEMFIVNGHLQSESGKHIVVQLGAHNLDDLDVTVDRPLHASWHPQDCHLAPTH